MTSEHESSTPSRWRIDDDLTDARWVDRSGAERERTGAAPTSAMTSASDVVALYRDARPFSPPRELRERVLHAARGSTGAGSDIAFDACGFPNVDENGTIVGETCLAPGVTIALSTSVADRRRQDFWIRVSRYRHSCS